MKFLIDECLSPELVGLARKRGHWESTHVTWLGLRSRKDWTIVRRAIDDGYVLVTNDATDFRPLLARQKVHAGLVCINVAPGLMSLDVQKRLFVVALDRIGRAERHSSMRAGIGSIGRSTGCIRIDGEAGALALAVRVGNASESLL